MVQQNRGFSKGKERSAEEEENHGTYGKKTEYTERTQDDRHRLTSHTTFVSFRIFRLLSVCSAVFFFFCRAGALLTRELTVINGAC
jgi:hypothetical protein